MSVNIPHCFPLAIRNVMTALCDTFIIRHHLEERLHPCHLSEFYGTLLSKVEKFKINVHQISAFLVFLAWIENVGQKFLSDL
jgi:hypothetical protein